MRIALWAALLIPLGAMYMGLKAKKYAWNCVLTISCALIVLLTKRTDVMLPLIAAYAFSIVGDYFMAHKGQRDIWYIAGIAGFLLAHLCFIGYASNRFAGSMRIYLAGAALALMLGWYLLQRVLPKVNGMPMKVAVVLYGIVSVVSVVLAAGLQGSNAFETLLYVLSMAMIVFSDSMIAETDFVGNKECSVYIMPTYYLCHILLAASVVVGMP